MSSLYGNMGSSPSMATGAASGLKGTGYKQAQLQQFSPEQMSLFQRLFGQLGPETSLGRLASGDQSQFEQLEAPALRQFAGLQGQLASRFSGMGTGARRSSGFQNAASGQIGDFAQQLQAQRMGLQRQAMQDLWGMSEQLLGQRPYENFLIKQQHKPSGWSKALGIGLPIAGAVGGALIPGAGPLGAALGSKIGTQLAGAFAGNPTDVDYSGIGNLPTSWTKWGNQGVTPSG